MSGAPRLRVGVTPWSTGGAGLADLVRQARLAEGLGFDSFFLPESHLHPGARPAPLVTLAVLAGATQRILLGTTSLLLPFRHPLLLAEEIATLDRLSGGRLILGLGRGFRRDTFEAFGIDPRTKRDRFEDVLATVLRAWGIEPWWPEAPAPPPGGVPLVEPRPFQQPHPPLWIAAFGPKAIDQAARLGLPYFASPMEPIETVEANLARYRAVGAVACVPLMRTALVSSDARFVERARESAAEEQRAITRRIGDAAGSASESSLFGAVDEVTDAARALAARLAVDHLVLRPPGASVRELGDRAVTELAMLRESLIG